MSATPNNKLVTGNIITNVLSFSIGAESHVSIASKDLSNAGTMGKLLVSCDIHVHTA